jgi:Rieske Fe-S protein
MIKKREMLISIYVFLMILTLTACGSKSASSTAAVSPSQSTTKDSAIQPDSKMNTVTYGTESKNDINTTAASPVTTASETPKVKDASKIVKNYSIQLQTLKFDDAITAISNKCTDVGGYVESSNISGTNVTTDNIVANRTASLKLRIPKEQYLNFKASFKGLGSIINQQETGENITQQYYDTDAHLTSLKVQEERLLELLKKSGDLKSILEIEKELETVRYSIESLTTSLKKMDNLVDYTTFTISINEVQEIKNVTVKPIALVDKISEGFKTSVDLLNTIFKDLLILIAYLLPFAVIILIAYPIGLYIYKSTKKRQNKIIPPDSKDEEQKDK